MKQMEERRLISKGGQRFQEIKTAKDKGKEAINIPIYL